MTPPDPGQPQRKPTGEERNPTSPAPASGTPFGCLELLDSRGKVRRRWKFRSGQYRIGFDGECQVKLNPDQPQRAAVRAAFGPGRIDLVAEIEPMLVLGQPWRQLRVSLATELMFCGYKLRFTPLPLADSSASPAPSFADRLGETSHEWSPVHHSRAWPGAAPPPPPTEATAEQLRSSMVVDPEHVIRLINAHQVKLEALEKAIDRLTQNVQMVIADSPLAAATLGVSNGSTWATESNPAESLEADVTRGDRPADQPSAAQREDFEVDAVAAAELRRLRNLLTGGGDAPEESARQDAGLPELTGDDLVADDRSVRSEETTSAGAAAEHGGFQAEPSLLNSAQLFDPSSPLAVLFRGELPQINHKPMAFGVESPAGELFETHDDEVSGVEGDTSEWDEPDTATSAETFESTAADDDAPTATGDEDSTATEQEESNAIELEKSNAAVAAEPTAAEACGGGDDDLSVEDYMQQLLSRLRSGPPGSAPKPAANIKKTSSRAGSGTSGGGPTAPPPSLPAANTAAADQPQLALTKENPPGVAAVTNPAEGSSSEVAGQPGLAESSQTDRSVATPMADLAGLTYQQGDVSNRPTPAIEPARGWNGQALSEELARLRELELDMRSIRSVANNTVDMVILAADRSRLVRNLSFQLLIALVGTLSAVGCSLMSELATHMQLMGTGVGSVLATYAAVKAVGSYQELIKLNRKRALNGSGEIAADKM